MFDFLKGYVSPRKLREFGVLGMNSRNYDIIAKYNKRSLYPLVDDKVQTKKLANSIDINTPHMIGLVEHQYEVKDLSNVSDNALHKGCGQSIRGIDGIGILSVSP